MVQKRQAFDLIVFDWEGTLGDNTRHTTRAFQVAFKTHQLPAPDYLAIRYVMGLSLREACQYLAPTLSELQLTQLVTTLQNQLSHTSSLLYEGVAQVLPQFYEAGYQLAVATGMSRYKLNEVLQKTGLAPYFATTRTADETRAKPHPQMLDEILSTLDIEKPRALMIGDTVSDLQMAYNAACAAVAMCYDPEHVNALQRYEPLHIFDNFHTLGAWLLSE
jgi:phosphoglycolate phosphatase